MKSGGHKNQGFSLLLSLMVMAMVLLLALGTAAGVTLSSKAGYSHLLRCRARIEAVAAAKIALGEMQTAVGPDCRTTALTGLFDKDDPDGAWKVAVWRTNRLKNDPFDAPPFIRRDPKSGALVDDRFSGARPFVAREQTLRTLVSGGDAEAPGPARTKLTLSDKDGRSVSAPAVRDGELAFAWAAFDEGLKALVLPDNPAPEAPRTTGPALIPGWVSSGRRPSPLARSPEDFVVEGLLDREAQEELGDDLAEESLGVLANNRSGGLRRDLTPFLLSDGKHEKTADADPLIADEGSPAAPYRSAGPRFGMLRAWARLGDDAKSGTLPVSAGSRIRVPDTGKASARFHTGTHPDLFDILTPVKPVVAPALSEAAVYLKISGDDSDRDKNGVPMIRLHLHPRVTLWNPYPVALAPARLMVHLRMCGSPVFKLVESGKRITGAISGWRVYADTQVNYATTIGTLLFMLDCPAIPPGESRLFLPARTAPLYGKSATTKSYDPSANKLVVSETLTNANFYLEGLDAFEDAGLKALADVSLKKESWRLENSAAEDFAASLSLPSPDPPTWAGLRFASTLGYASVSVKFGSGTTPVSGWPEGVSEPLSADIDAPPPPGTRDGVRLRRIFETPANRVAYSPDGYDCVAPLENHSPFAPLSCVHPLADFTPAASGSNGRRPEYFGAYTRDAPHRSSEPHAFAPSSGVTAFPFGMPIAFPFKQVVACGFPTGAATAKNFAEFANAPLSPFAWHPPRLLGESGITPLTPPESTNDGLAASDWSGLPASAQHAADALRLSEAPEFPRFSDMRHELNHIVWDEFALLTGDEKQRELFLKNPAANPLPNARLIPVPGAAGVSPDASSVMTRGALNVNSLSVVAWKQWLASLRNKEAFTPFVRFSHSPGEKLDQGPWIFSPGAWHGHRRLSDFGIESLAEHIVEEVRRRGPFLSLSDFVNRRLDAEKPDLDTKNPTKNACGALCSAIGKAYINQGLFPPELVIPRDTGLPGTRYRANQKAWNQADGLSGVLMQGDLLAAGGESLSARSDTFRLLVRGECEGVGVTLEVLVQRTPAPVRADPENPREPDARSADIFGRRLTMVRVREIR